MNILLTTLNAKYIHKNLALRWLYCASNRKESTTIKEFVIKDDVNRIVNEIEQMSPDVIVFSTYIWNIDPIMECVRLLKERNHLAHIILGGPEVSYESFDLIDKGVDAISIGEGEISLWNYIDMLAKKECYEVAGMYTKAFPNKQYQRVDVAYNETLENPYFLDIDEKDMDKRYLYLETSRGCPYGCTYCLSSTDRHVRLFSLDYIMDILQRISISKVKQVKLLDRTFNVDPKRALKLVRYINEHCVNQIFQFEIVAETLSEELLCFLENEADLSRFRFEIGVQSFHAPTLYSVGRIQNNKRLKEVIARLRRAGAIMHVDLIAGLPYENYDQFSSSFKELFELHGDELQLGVLKLLKGTKLRRQVEEFGFIYDEHPPYSITSTAWLSEDEMEVIKQSAYALEKYYNSNRCRYVIDTLVKEHVCDAFLLFVKLGDAIKGMKRPYQVHEMYESFLHLNLDIDNNHLEEILLTGYYGLFPQKPKRFLEQLDLTKRKEVMKYVEEQHLYDALTLYHYGLVERCFLEESGYQVVIYNQDQKLPKRYFVNKEMNVIKEMHIR